MKGAKILTILLIILFLISCAPEESKEIKIGAVFSLTGYAAAFGEEARDAAQLAVDEINENGGINNKQLKLLIEDDGTDPTKAVTAFTKLVTVDNVDAVVGGTWDFNYNSIAPLADQYNRTLITPQNVKTTGLTVNDHTFVMRPSMIKVVGTLEEYIKEHNIKRVAIVRFVSAFGEDITQGLKNIMENTGGEFVLDETYEQIGGNDFLTTMVKIKEVNPDAVFIDMVDNDLVTFMKRVKENNLPVQVFSHGAVSDAVANKELDTQMLNGLVFFDYDKPESVEFIKKYKEKTQKEPGHSADGAYDAVMILAQALKEKNPEQLHHYIEEKKFSTINGDFSFKDHVIDTKSVLIREVMDSKIVTLDKKTVS